MSNWMSDETHTGRKVVVESLKSRIADMAFKAKGCREAYKEDYMRVPLAFLADAFDEAAFILQSRLDAVLKAGKIDPRLNIGIPRIPDVWENAAVYSRKAVRTHGRDCPKVPHTGAGYLHSAEDDGRYDVDGVWYCGRCHEALS